MFKILKLFILSIFLMSFGNDVDNVACMGASDKKELSNGWYLWEPYQFQNITKKGSDLTGIDIEITKYLTKKIGLKVIYQELEWDDHQLLLNEGQIDMASGVSYNDDRAESLYFSIPYRFEENSLFVLKDFNKEHNISNIDEYLEQISRKNFRLAVIDGFVYANNKIDNFIKDPANEDVIFRFANNEEALIALIDKKIDGFLGERISGFAIIANQSAVNIVDEIRINLKVPVHFTFSKKTVPIEVVELFNGEIEKFRDSQEYKKIVRDYVASVFLEKTIHSEWFFIICVIGIIAFTISGIIIAVQENATLFSTFLFAMLPALGGGIVRDVILQQGSIAMILDPSYLYYVSIIVLCGFIFVKFANKYIERQNHFLIKFFDNLLFISDSLGQAAFIVIGVAVTITSKIEPVILWGTFFAFVTGNVGGMLRDLIRKDRIIACLSSGMSAEISILWGFVLSLLLGNISYNFDQELIKYYIIIVVLGAFITNLIIFYCKIPNIRFRAENDKR